MAKKIFKGIGGALGIGKKKKVAEPVAAMEQKGPVITDINVPNDPRKKRLLSGGPTILGGESDTLG